MYLSKTCDQIFPPSKKKRSAKSVCVKREEPMNTLIPCMLSALHVRVLQRHEGYYRCVAHYAKLHAIVRQLQKDCCSDDFTLLQRYCSANRCLEDYEHRWS